MTDLTEPDAPVNESRLAAMPSTEPESDAAFRERIQRAMRRQLDIIEKVQALIAPVSTEEADGSARIVALLNKSLLDIATMGGSGADKDDDDDDDMPRDIDEFRRELARRIEQIIEAGNAAPAAGGSGVSGDTETAQR